jgi:type 2 lantibiotic biosynthesis protein LanM
MNPHVLQDPIWYRATTLSERIASLRSVPDASRKVELNTDTAEREIGRWRSEPPFNRGSYFVERLTTSGISENDFLYLLSEPITAVADRFQALPTWLVDLAEAFSNPPSSKPIPLPEVLRRHAAAGFLDSIEPLISQGRDRVHQGIQAIIQAAVVPDLPFDPATVEDIFFANLPLRLIQILSRTMVLELNVARLQGLLEGDTPEARFSSFLRRVRRREIALAIMQEYPVLARHLTLTIDHWVTFTLEFLQHLCTDWTVIRTTFSRDKSPGVLVQVEGHLSDDHRGGRSVQIAKFSSGLRIVYKPRSLTLDLHFQQLLAWVNERGADRPFRTLEILDRGSYGWMEFVAAQSCSCPDEVQRFYERQGGYLALLFMLEATDFHFDNLIAAGEQPVLIDTEALFHPRVGGSHADALDELVSRTLNSSVLRVGLLPHRRWSNAESDGVDISGIGAIAGQLTPREISYWDGCGTDEMRLGRKKVVIPEAQNRPSLNGTRVDALTYAEAICAGFSKVYRLLLKYRYDLLSDEGPVTRFADDEVRVILRPTQSYSVLLRESFHPDALRDALHRERIFSRLWGAVEHLPYLARVIPAEHEDLLRGDTPRFSARPQSVDLWSSSNERLANFFDESSLSLVRHRVEQLSEYDLAQQLWFVRASVATLSVNSDRTHHTTQGYSGPRTIVDYERLLAAARAIGDRLDALTIRGERQITWLGLTLTNERRWSVTPLGLDLYSGLPGLMLFLAYLGAITGEERYATLAEAALRRLRREMERSESFVTLTGGFNGWGGIIYVLTHLGTLWNQHRLLEEAEGIAGRLPALVERDEHLDIISGVAGCIGSLLSLYSCTPSERTLATMIQCGDRLVTRAQPTAQGIGWSTKVARTRPLTGFSHGAAGMAWALLKLAALTGNERFRAAGLDAIAYERSLFSPEAENWPDLREFDTRAQTKANNEQVRFMTAWCHGAPGIGLARLSSLPELEDVETRSEIAVALQTTMTHGFGGNHSLCHGDLGNLELLLQAGQMLRDRSWDAEVNRLAASILDSIHQNGWVCGIPLDVESPGLMTGLAGIGYGLLRLAEPQRVPSVLLLEGPVGHRSTIEKAALSS